MERKILNVFIASPGDLTEERKTLRDVAARLNSVLGRRINWQIELLGWEDTLPGFARPQELINKDVESCDLFVGILWKRWGSPSGQYSSGFEEEFEIARAKRISSTTPEIWLYFKNVDPELCSDPGEQLKKVLDFKKQQIDKRELLFKDFSTCLEFKDVIYDALNSYILDLREQSISNTSGKLEVSAGHYKSTEEMQTSKSVASEDDQIAELLKDTLNKLETDNIQSTSFWNKTRLHLLSYALFSSSHLGETFGTHEVNLIYRNRKYWNLRAEEKEFLLRSYFANEYKVIPGCFWMESRSKDDLVGMLKQLAVSDLSTDVKSGAIRTLQEIDFIADETFAKLFIKNNIKEEKLMVSFLELLKKCSSKNILDIISPLLETDNEDIKKAAINTYVIILYRHDPEASFRMIIERASVMPAGYPPEDDLNVTRELLLQALKKGNQNIREFAGKYLLRKNLLDNVIAEELLKDSESFMRKVGFEWLINNGKDFTINDVSKLFPKAQGSRTFLGGLFGNEVTEKDVIPILLAKMDQSELEDLATFYSSHGKEAYKALSKYHAKSMLLSFRNNLSDNFKDFQEKSIEKMVNAFGEVAATIRTSYDEDLTEFVRESFIAIALEGLLDNLEPKDLNLAKKYLGKTKYGMGDESAIAIIKAIGSSRDVDFLLDFARSSKDHLKKLSIQAAINLSDNKENLIETLLNSKDKISANEAINNLKLLKPAMQINIAKKYLQSEYTSVRIEVTNILCKYLKNSEIDKILDGYLNENSYYYNVVYYLDKHLYGLQLFGNKD